MSKNFFYRKLKKLLKFDVVVKSNNFIINLPFNHNYLEYKTDYPNYDETILKVVKSLGKKNSSIIDVGANCGDTIIQMFFKNKNKKYYGVEPDELFYKYLKKNLNQNKLSNKIKIFKNFITSKKKKGFLNGSSGTKKFVPSKINKIENQITLDKFVDINFIKNLELIKIDTDGYDYDVLKSGSKIIKKFKPIIFFECQIEIKKQVEQYINVIKNLKNFFYSFYFFDNFGNFIVKSNDLNDIRNLILYIYNQNNFKKKSIYYYDILACTKNDYKRILKSAKL